MCSLLSCFSALVLPTHVLHCDRLLWPCMQLVGRVQSIASCFCSRHLYTQPIHGEASNTHVEMSDAGSAQSIEAKRLQLNLKVLQRHDPSIVEILDSTSYVVLYKYVPAPAPSDADSQDSPADMQWVRRAASVVVFVRRLLTCIRYAFVVTTRRSRPA